MAKKTCLKLTPKEKKTVLNAMDLLIDSEQDSVNRTALVKKLRKS